MMTWFFSGLAFPLFEVKKNDNENIHMWSYLFAGMMLIASILNHFFTFECGGLTRVQTFNKIHGIKDKLEKKN